MRRKKTPEQQNYFIQQMTSSLKPIQDGLTELMFGPPKAKPYWCDHCEGTMTKTGRLPAMKDQYSWTYWIGCQVGEHGVQKVHSLGSSMQSRSCVPCHKFHEQIAKEYEAEGGE